ncbi:uncharacterized protein LOC136066834 [Quercus suber]|uniref:uncharacterized protein LOC136066834 n=1 Tax=Quercus suber TaxID=58331 RepID=UPI0032E01BD0
MRKYLSRVMRLTKKFDETNFVQIPRKENMEADTLVKEASVSEVVDKFDEIQYMPSIDIPKVQQVQSEGNWMASIVSYLKEGRLPEEEDEARKLRVRSARYVLMDEVLYKRGFSQPYLQCLAPDEVNYILREIHKGACGNYSGARSLVHKVVRAGYYWPNMQADAKAYVKVYDQCQRFSNVPRQPSEYLTLITALWPFAQWGLDILGPFSIGVRQIKFLVNHYSSPAHPQANGQDEVANRSLLKIIKTRLERVKGAWPDEVPGVLWVYRMTVRTPTGETPFNLAYGTEAVIPAEVHMANHRVAAYQDKDNEEQLRLNLDLIDEARMDAEQRMARYKNLMARQYDATIKPRRFDIGDLVLKRVSLATKNPAHGKLGPNWEGPYRVVNCKRQGSYYLEALDGRKLEHPWNVEHLRRYYQ